VKKEWKMWHSNKNPQIVCLGVLEGVGELYPLVAGRVTPGGIVGGNLLCKILIIVVNKVWLAEANDFGVASFDFSLHDQAHGIGTIQLVFNTRVKAEESAYYIVPCVIDLFST